MPYSKEDFCRECFKASELARIFGVSEKTIRRWGQQGIMPSIRIGGVRRYHLPKALKAIREAGERKGVAR